MIKQLNESIKVKQNVTIAVYSHERNEIKSTVMVLANIVNAILSNSIFSVERGRWTEFDNELVMRRDAIEKLHKSIQKSWQDLKGNIIHHLRNLYHAPPQPIGYGLRCLMTHQT
jgi:hypothetical protein